MFQSRRSTAIRAAESETPCVATHPRTTARASAQRPPRPLGRVRQFLASIGPGVITGAADDDPSGIATYSSAGALLGTSMLWTAFITWPLMGVVQFMCARVGMVTGQGLGAHFRRKFPLWIVLAFSVALLAANSINIGADLSGMADAAQLLTRIPGIILVGLFGLGITAATIFFPYQRIANILKWLALVLLAYIAAAFMAGGSWAGVLRDTFVPSLPKGKDAWGMLVAILGTTISPYLFYWQASEETEEEKTKGRMSVASRRGASGDEIINRKIDVGIGTFFSNLVMYFIILTTALTLHRHGITRIDTSEQAAKALGPIAGPFCSLLYTVGIIGTGFLAIPTMSGSAAYAFAETFRWREGLDNPLSKAPAFYSIIILSTLIGIGLNFAHVNPVRALYWSAVLNGLLAPFVLVAILVVASDRKLMCGQPSSPPSRIIVAVTTLLMFAAGVGMFIF
jgi:NRAMP (natural resistance-associated macrophage protein)-like metal ion transporter